jgi:hypothetical protein
LRKPAKTVFAKVQILLITIIILDQMPPSSRAVASNKAGKPTLLSIPPHLHPPPHHLEPTLSSGLCRSLGHCTRIRRLTLRTLPGRWLPLDSPLALLTFLALPQRM